MAVSPPPSTTTRLPLQIDVGLRVLLEAEVVIDVADQVIEGLVDAGQVPPGKAPCMAV
jgi:hypothetical protein